MNKIENYLGVANHDIQMANNSQELKSYVASILYENDKLQQENNKLKEKIDGVYEERTYLYNKLSTEKEQLNNLVNSCQEEIRKLKKQLEYLRSGEYLNQLKFERNMLEDIVQNGGVSKEDKEFIDMTHRNTELLEQINKAIEHIKYIKRVYVELYPQQLEEHERELLKILGGDVEDE